MISEKQRETLAVTETVIESVARLVHVTEGGSPDVPPATALKHKVASALMKRLAVHLPQPE